jgi:hypothetical protein
MSRIEADALQRAGARLGEAILDPGRWPDLMRGVCQAIDATGAILLQSDIRTSDVPRTAAIEELIDNYFRGSWHLRDTRARGAALLLGGETVIIDEGRCHPG